MSEMLKLSPEHLSDIQESLYSLEQTLAQVYKRLDTERVGGPSPNKPLDWERYALGLLAVLFGVLSWFAVEIRGDVTAIRRAQDQQITDVKYIEQLRLQVTEHGKTVALLEYRLQRLEARLPPGTLLMP